VRFESDLRQIDSRRTITTSQTASLGLVQNNKVMGMANDRWPTFLECFFKTAQRDEIAPTQTRSHQNQRHSVAHPPLRQARKNQPGQQK